MCEPWLKLSVRYNNKKKKLPVTNLERHYLYNWQGRNATLTFYSTFYTINKPILKLLNIFEIAKTKGLKLQKDYC